MTLAEIVARWRRDAALLREHGAVEAAATKERDAAELAEWERQHALEELTPAQAAEELNVHPSTVRRRYPGRRTITRAELHRDSGGGPDLAGEILRETARRKGA